ncbi:DUF2127 domain-containing protein [Chroococcidiopsidales cyanobacterium LEGE 13417]|nr:DUF2127 domain-containing protein [Chroococcidiopsidales cyanobacterium LEGE 13417]
MRNQRPSGLVAIVIYKTFVAIILAIAAIAILLALQKYQFFTSLSEAYILEGKLNIIEWLIEKITNIKQQTLQFSGIATGAYAAVTAIEAIGLWYEKAWARILVLVLVGISIPPEIFELIKGITILKLVVFVVNIAVFWYLLRHFPKHGRQL